MSIGRRRFQGLNSRKNRFPMRGFTIMNFSVPLSLTLSCGVPQFGMARLVFCSRFQPVEVDGQETMAVLVSQRDFEQRRARAKLSELQKPLVTFARCR